MTPMNQPYPTPAGRARAEIARRRTLAEAATEGPWKGGRVGLMGGRIGVVVSQADSGLFIVADRDQAARAEDARHIAANDPTHVLAVLAAADAVLSRHQPNPVGSWASACTVCEDHLWPCPDAAAVLALYAPEPTP